VLLFDRLQELPSQYRDRFQLQLEEHDRSVDECCNNIKLSLDAIVSKQRQLADTFGELIDEVLRAPTQSVHNDDGATGHDELPGHVPSPPPQTEFQSPPGLD